MAGLPSTHEVALTLRSLSLKQRRILLALGLLLIGLLVAILWQVDKRASDIVAANGGSLTEGIIGTPRFINPLLAASDADRDMVALVYSGLMRVGPDGQLIPDLASDYTVSEDGLTYTFTLRDNLSWHDGKPLTTDDVEFTVLKAQDPLLKSPKRASWAEIRVEKVSPTEISFHLKQPYPQFLENTTMGILPKHLWNKLDTDTFSLNQFNIEPVGSGPYEIKSISKNNIGIADYYDLKPFKNFALGRPKIDLIRVRFYRNEAELADAYKTGQIDSLSAISAENAKLLEQQGAQILRAPLPRVFGVFFNQNKAPVLANVEVRQALNLAIDREEIIDSVLKGYGVPAEGPLPRLFLSEAGDVSTSTPAERIATARAYLDSHGWTWNEDKKVWEKKGKTATQTLAFSITTSDTPELKNSAELIKAAWEKMGAQVTLKVFEIGDLDLNIIRPRQYEALFFGEILGRTPDLFSFWGSQQRLDPGLNIAEYANTAVDKLLSETRTLSDHDELYADYQKIQDLITADIPAVFVYSPDFLYILPSQVKRATLPPVNTPSDRFLSIYHWYSATDRVWKIFINNTNSTH